MHTVMSQRRDISPKRNYSSEITVTVMLKCGDDVLIDNGHKQQYTYNTQQCHKTGITMIK